MIKLTKFEIKTFASFTSREKIKWTTKTKIKQLEFTYLL